MIAYLVRFTDDIRETRVTCRDSYDLTFPVKGKFLSKSSGHIATDNLLAAKIFKTKPEKLMLPYKSKPLDDTIYEIVELKLEVVENNDGN